MKTKTDLRLLTMEQAAEIIGVHPMTLRRLIKAGKLPAYRLGHKILRVKVDEVLAVMKKNAA